MKSKKLILTADDFGLHESINTAVETAHQNGILTSASLVVNGEAFEHAIDIAKRNINLGVGIHLTLVGEKPISPIKKIHTIVNEEGKLFENHNKFCRDILIYKINLDHIAVECKAQIDKFLQSGLHPTHIDSHRHLHLFPPIFNRLSSILSTYNIKKIRLLNIPLFDFYYSSGLKQYMFFILLQYTRFLGKNNFRYPDWFVGFFKSGRINKSYLKDVLFKLKPGITEISFHPGLNNTQIGEKYGFWDEYHNWKCNWEEEYQVLLDSEIKEIIESNNIELINYSYI